MRNIASNTEPGRLGFSSTSPGRRRLCVRTHCTSIAPRHPAALPTYGRTRIPTQAACLHPRIPPIPASPRAPPPALSAARCAARGVATRNSCSARFAPRSTRHPTRGRARIPSWLRLNWPLLPFPYVNASPAPSRSRALARRWIYLYASV